MKNKINKAIEKEKKNSKSFDRAYSKASNVDHKGAIGDYAIAIKINLNSSVAYFNRGISKTAIGDNRGAIQDYSEAIKINPNNPTAYINRGIVRASINDYHRQPRLRRGFYSLKSLSYPFSNSV